MTKAQMIEAILETYDKEMVEKYGKWIKRQSKSTVEMIYNARASKMADIDKIKDYWMATMDMGEGRDYWENEIWNTKEGMEDLIDWFNDEIECGLDKEEMERVIESVR